MNLRSEKYEENNTNFLSRTAKNENMYSSLSEVDLSRIKTNNNVSVISDATKQIDIEKIKRYIESEDKEENARTILESTEIKQKEIIDEVEKDYDIVSVLQRAKSNRENQEYSQQRHRKFDEIDLDILKNLNLDGKDKIEEPQEDELNTEEKTIVDLIHNISAKKAKDKTEDLFDELMNGHDDTKVLAISELSDESFEKQNTAKLIEKIKEDQIIENLENLENINIENENISSLEKTIIEEKPKETTNEDNIKTKELISEEEYEKMCMKAVKGKELTDLEITQMQEFDKHHYKDKNKKDEIKVEKIEPKKKKSIAGVDKSFFTNSMSFSKGDFEGFEEMEKKVKKSSAFMKFAIVFLTLILIITTVIVVNYIFELGWF